MGASDCAQRALNARPPDTRLPTPLQNCGNAPFAERRARTNIAGGVQEGWGGRGQLEHSDIVAPAKRRGKGQMV
jgi:hypothetical protein